MIVKLKKLKAYAPLLWILMIPVLNLFYGPLNNGRGDVNSLVTDLDKLIPFVPLFIIPYLLWYPFIMIMLICFFVKNIQVFYRTLLTLCLGLLSCYLVYLLFQTTVPRPVIPDHGVLYQLVGFVYNTDNPFNCFPSIHVLTSYLMIKAVSTDSANFSRRSRIAVYIFSLTIICSTFFVKQHVLLDAAGAIGLVEFLWFMVSRLFQLKQHALPKGAISSEEN